MAENFKSGIKEIAKKAVTRNLDKLYEIAAEIKGSVDVKTAKRVYDYLLEHILWVATKLAKVDRINVYHCPAHWSNSPFSCILAISSSKPSDIGLKPGQSFTIPSSRI